MRVGAQLSERARRAVLRGFEVADDVVVFEGRGHQEQDIERHAEEGQAPGAAMSQPTSHL